MTTREATPPPSVDAPQRGTRAWTLALVCVATFMLMLDLTVVSIALLKMRDSLDADFSGMQWVIDSYTLTLAAFLVIAGSFADRIGRKKIFMAGMVVFTLASLAAGLAPEIVTLNVARAVQGVGAAIMFAVGPALIGQEFHGKDRGKAFGIFGGVIGLAIAIGPMLGGLVVNGLSWRWLFLVNVPIGVLALLAGAMKLRESRDPKPYRLDWFGAVVFGLGLTLIVLGFLRAERSGWTSTPILSMFAGGLALLVLFILLQRRLGEAAMFDLSLFRIPSFTGITFATLFANAACLPAILLQVLYMQNVLGFTPWETGIRLIPQTLLMFVVAAATGGIAHKFPPGPLVGAAITLIGVGLGLMLLVTPDSSWLAMLPSLMVVGAGMGIFNPPRATITIGVTEPAKAGMASGMGETFQQVGVAIGIAAFGALFHHRVGEEFAASETGRQIGDPVLVEELGRGIALSGQNAVASAVPADLAEQAVAAAREAYVHSVVFAIVLCGVAAVIGAILAFALIRGRDMHPSAAGAGEAGSATPA